MTTTKWISRRSFADALTRTNTKLANSKIDTIREDAVAAGVRSVRSRIETACTESKRTPDEVTLVAVTKTVPAPIVNVGRDAGLSHFGENRVQDAENKVRSVAGGHWHLVGQLQRNKARQAIDLFSLIHSVDSIRLAHRLEFVRANEECAVLIQVNLTDSESQGGISPNELTHLATVIDQETSLELRGLMTIAPINGSQATLRACFGELRKLRDGLRKTLPNQPLRELSMGMTNDFELAITEGATIIRVGRAIFGHRPQESPR
ncbi:MAG: YggS family pyridoxal phosphate-dependent enzyme [Chloroflexi bacterium]|nr:YggS family pyridoxal phosphate-dependent enzyme [Chloroflexota bacterium]HCU73843.1 YggS family pyridoxal phosphate-dependent enzyme [Chloroflexota bacterium]